MAIRQAVSQPERRGCDTAWPSLSPPCFGACRSGIETRPPRLAWRGHARGEMISRAELAFVLLDRFIVHVTTHMPVRLNWLYKPLHGSSSSFVKERQKMLCPTYLCPIRCVSSSRKLRSNHCSYHRKNVLAMGKIPPSLER